MIITFWQTNCIPPIIPCHFIWPPFVVWTGGWLDLLVAICLIFGCCLKCCLTALGSERGSRRTALLGPAGVFTGLPGPIKILLTLIIPGKNWASVDRWTEEEYFTAPLFKRSYRCVTLHVVAAQGLRETRQRPHSQTRDFIFILVLLLLNIALVIPNKTAQKAVCHLHLFLQMTAVLPFNQWSLG